MRKELSQARLDELHDRGASNLAVGCVIAYEGQDSEKWTITDFSGYTDTEDDGVEHEFISVHINNGNGVNVEVEIEDVTRRLFCGEIKPIAPDWFLEEWKRDDAAKDDAEASERKQLKRTLAEIFKADIVVNIDPMFLPIILDNKPIRTYLIEVFNRRKPELRERFTQDKAVVVRVHPGMP